MSSTWDILSRSTNENWKQLEIWTEWHSKLSLTFSFQKLNLTMSATNIFWESVCQVFAECSVCMCIRFPRPALFLAAYFLCVCVFWWPDCPLYLLQVPNTVHQHPSIYPETRQATALTFAVLHQHVPVLQVDVLLLPWKHTDYILSSRTRNLPCIVIRIMY